MNMQPISLSNAISPHQTPDLVSRSPLILLKKVSSLKEAVDVTKELAQSFDRLSDEEKKDFSTHIYCLDKFKSFFKERFKSKNETMIVLYNQVRLYLKSKSTDTATNSEESSRKKEDARGKFQRLVNKLKDYRATPNNPVSMAYTALPEIDSKIRQGIGQPYMSKEECQKYEVDLSHSTNRLICRPEKKLPVNKQIFALRFEENENNLKKPILCIADRKENLPETEHRGWSHSCFFAGKSVAGAGEISVNEHGKITHLDNNTGHYQSNPMILANNILLLKDFLADKIDIEVNRTFYQDGIRTYETDESLKNISKDTALAWANIMKEIQKYCIYNQKAPDENFLTDLIIPFIQKKHICEQEQAMLVEQAKKMILHWQQDFKQRQNKKSSSIIASSYYPVLWQTSNH